MIGIERARFDGRVERWAMRAAASLGCVIALGAGYAAATGMASMTVFGIQMPGITNGYANSMADSDKGLLFSEGATNAQAAIGMIMPDGATSVVDSELAMGSAPGEMAEDPAGNVWFADLGVPSGIVKIAPDGETTRFPTSEQPTSLAIGPDGNAWFAEQGDIAKVSADGQITRYTSGATAMPIDIAAGADGAMWFTIPSPTPAIGRITLDGTVTSYSNGLTKTAGGPLKLALGPDGNMWFTEMGDGPGPVRSPEIGRITPTGVITEFQAGLTIATSRPWGIAAAPDGNMWFTDMGSTRRVGEVTPNGTITEFSISPGTFMLGPSLATGPDGKLWFNGNTQSAGALGQLDVGAPPASLTPPEITGSRRQGDLDSCDGARWSDWAGRQPSTSANSFDGYQWLRDGDPIVGQTAQTYTLTAADDGHELSCKLTATYTLFPATVSATSAAISVPAVVPDAPTNVTAVGGDGQATVSFAPPVSDGGASVDTYTVTASPGGQSATGSASPITVPGLTNGTSYTFTVGATNSTGTGPNSAASNPVIPAAPSRGEAGGAGGAIPDLAITVEAPAQIPVTHQATFSLAVADLNGAGASGIHAIVTLPAGATVDGTAADRGPGCTAGATAGTLDCNLDFLSGTLVAHITIGLTLPTAGEQTLTATVSDAQGDKNTVNNTASATVQVEPATTTATISTPTPGPKRTPTAAAHITGTAKANHLTGTSKADVIKALAGNDWVNGGAGNDIIYGGPGNDTIYGGRGADRIFSGPGNDTIHAADGTKDMIDCGTGRDVVYADKHDKVAKNCEVVHRI